MSAEQNLAASQRILAEAWNEGNLEVIDQLCASDCVDHDLASHEDTRGIEANKERVQMYRTAMPDLKVSVVDSVASGDEEEDEIVPTTDDREEEAEDEEEEEY